MRKLSVFAIIVWLTGLSLPAFAGSIIATIPNNPDPAAHYLFYLHGRGPQDFGVEKAKEDYRAIVSALSDRGYVVVSEVREKGEQIADSAEKVAQQVKKLIASGVAPAKVTVAGYSRGGQITLIASGLIANPSVNFVILAGCFTSSAGTYQTFLDAYGPPLQGRMLSLYDQADPTFGSCLPYFQAAAGKVQHKEIVLDTGKGHDVFHKPTDNWTGPLIEWVGAPRN